MDNGSKLSKHVRVGFGGIGIFAEGEFDNRETEGPDVG